MYYVERIYKAISKRFYQLTTILSWNRYKSELVKWEGSADGGSCVVICNGPSLKNIDMSSLKDIDCFGLNRSYMAYKDWGFVPKYFVCVNELVLDQFSKDIENINANKFINFSKKNLFLSENSYFLKLAFNDRVVSSLQKSVSCAATVTFVAIQLALIMGYKRIGIVGLDHSFSGPGRPNETLQSDAEDENHFLSNYFSGGIQWEYPDLEKNEKGYELIEKYAKLQGVEIFDLTENGKSNAFQKSTLFKFLNC